MKAARLVKPSAAGQSDIVRIPLDQLDDSPYQLRRDMDWDELEELTRSIGDQRLLNPILVRQVDKGWEIISEHRRTAAYRRLQFSAKTAAARRSHTGRASLAPLTCWAGALSRRGALPATRT